MRLHLYKKLNVFYLCIDEYFIGIYSLSREVRHCRRCKFSFYISFASLRVKGQLIPHWRARMLSEMCDMKLVFIIGHDTTRGLNIILVCLGILCHEKIVPALFYIMILNRSIISTFKESSDNIQLLTLCNSI